MKNTRVLYVFIAQISSAVFAVTTEDCEALARNFVSPVASQAALSPPATLPELLQRLPDELERAAPEESKRQKDTESVVHRPTTKDEAALLKCFASTGRLVGVSTFISAAGAMLVNRKRYATSYQSASVFNPLIPTADMSRPFHTSSCLKSGSAMAS